jgi:hypothetical protein
MTKKSTKLILPKLYIKYSYTETGGEVSPGEDDNSNFAHREDTIREYRYDYVTKTFPTGDKSFSNWETVECQPEVLLGSKVFLAIVEYYDGGTFGRTCGYHEIVGAFSTKQEAEEVVNSSKAKWDGGYFGQATDVLVVKLDIED